MDIADAVMILGIALLAVGIYLGVGLAGALIFTGLCTIGLSLALARGK